MKTENIVFYSQKKTKKFSKLKLFVGVNVVFFTLKICLCLHIFYSGSPEAPYSFDHGNWPVARDSFFAITKVLVVGQYGPAEIDETVYSPDPLPRGLTRQLRLILRVYMIGEHDSSKAVELSVDMSKLSISTSPTLRVFIYFIYYVIVHKVQKAEQ